MGSFFEEIKNIGYDRQVYKNIGEEKLDLIIAYPKEKTPKSCVFFIHGGGWKSDTWERLKPHALYAASKGCVGVSISYRLMSEGADTDVRNGLEDCIDALAFVRRECEKKYGKLNYIAVGDSAGGYYAVCLGCRKILDRVRKGVKGADYVIDLNGIVDLCGKWSYGIKMNKNDNLSRQEIEMSFSPLYQVSKNDAPVLIMHGDKDKTVELSNSQAYKDALEQHGVKSELCILEGAAHAFILFDYRHDNDYVGKVIESIFVWLSEKNII